MNLTWNSIGQLIYNGRKIGIIKSTYNQGPKAYMAVLMNSIISDHDTVEEGKVALEAFARSWLMPPVTSGNYDLLEAITEFETKLPGWWFTIGVCSVSADASCGPDRNGPDADLLTDDLFDQGFHNDEPQPATAAQSLRIIMAEALAARGRVKP